MIEGGGGEREKPVGMCKHRSMVNCPIGTLNNCFELIYLIASFPTENMGICAWHEVILLFYKLGAFNIFFLYLYKIK